MTVVKSRRLNGREQLANLRDLGIDGIIIQGEKKSFTLSK
jgi:hypothetical protein